ncbi:peroxin PEX11-1 [Talaromyces proteolyticus]|uniref:Peroxin PEX11-1 n=1 Tax=Talaromyces proteolyticus TaxID=1131652 RepID=A0AAD4KY87_9EURO|nr:peroxin PEX11-1 [Talaromyces proteolyticus]KAH8703132.1 peroxin PEX11-1 [Talaromyces proteolyticus]
MAVQQDSAQQQPAKPAWKQLSNFTNGHPLGIEKTLRLIQAICQVLASSIFISYIPNAVYAVGCATAKNQIALARRYLRFFKFIESFNAGYTAWQVPAATGTDSVKKLLEVSKWTVLGVYFLMEDFTILDAMGVWVAPWAQDLFTESNKWWFYAISLSLIGSTFSLFFPPSQSNSEADKTTKTENEKKPVVKQTPDLTPLVKKIIVDGCDILLPGSFLGWIQATPTQVGVAMIVSTLVTSKDIWVKVNM